MSSLKRLFGKSPANQGPTIDQSINRLHETLSMLQKREDYLNKKIQGELTTIKQNAKNKRGLSRLVSYLPFFFLLLSSFPQRRTQNKIVRVWIAGKRVGRRRKRTLFEPSSSSSSFFFACWCQTKTPKAQKAKKVLKVKEKRTHTPTPSSFSPSLVASSSSSHLTPKKSAPPSFLSFF